MPASGRGSPAGAWPGPDGVPRRTSPLTVAAAVLPILGGLVLFAMTTSVQLAVGTGSSSTGTAPSSPLILLLPAAFLVLTGAIQVLRWFTTTYTVFPTELVIDEGVLSREHRVLPFARIQQADTHQNLVGQVLGLTELKVDVAGSSGSTQVKLRLLDAGMALALRDYVLRRRAELHAEATGGPPGVPAPGRDPAVLAGAGAATFADRLAAGAATIGSTVGAGETPVLTIAPARLAIGAMTHTTIALGIPVVAAGALWFAAFNIAQSSNRVAGFILAGLGLGVVVTLMLVAATVLGSILNHYGFAVSLAGDDIHLRYGLLETRNLTVPRRRVQQITLVDNPLRRLAGLTELHLHTAAAPGAGEATTRFTIPVLAAADADALLRTLMGDDRWRLPPLTPRSSVARRRAIVRRVAAVLAVAVVPAVVARPAGLILIALALLGIPWGDAAHRRAGQGTTTTVAALAHGVLHHRLDLVPVDRIQSARTTRSVFQRRVGLATLHLDIAGSARAPELWDVDVDTAAALRRELPRRSAPRPG